jgi:hypothetical protein
VTEVHIEVPHPHRLPEPLFDWQHDIERLAQQTQAAIARDKSDEWALAEAECTLDLIVAELVAVRRDRTADVEAAANMAGRLEAWHAQVEGLIRELQSLPS